MIDMLHSAKRVARILSDLLLLCAGWISYAYSGSTKAWAAQSFIRLFCASGGLVNDLISKLLSWRHPPQHLGALPGAVPPLADPGVATAALQKRGYYVFEQRLPESVCDRLLHFALTEPAFVRPRDGETRLPVQAVYDPRKPLAVRYDFPTEVLINNPDVQALMSDPTILSLAQAYLGAQPIADVISMWWHTDFSDQPDAEAAQFYHFDMDRVKWIKFFFYLTDVTHDTGPHCFIARSHLTGGIPRQVLAKGYVRLTDEEVAAYFNSEDFIEFSGARGTILAEDTRGLHKGMHVLRGHRLVLQIQFSNSLFGPPYPKAHIKVLHAPGLTALARLYPRIYSAFLAQEIRT